MSGTKKSRSASALLLGLALLMTLFVVPASAQDAGVAVARGAAFIGYETVTPAGVTPECVNQVGAGDGLLFPVDIDPANPTIVELNPNNEKCYSFDTDNDPVGPPAVGRACETVGIINLGLHVGDCRIEAEGNVGPSSLTGLGGFCGHSEGTDGRGTFTSPRLNPTVSLELSDLGWLASVGSVFVVTGDWADTGSTKTGTIVALVQASGNTSFGNLVQSCSDRSQGADSFDVNIISALVEIDLP